MSGTKFECAYCCEDKTEDHPHIVDEYPICRDCATEVIIPMFHQALKFEHAYPVKWGGSEVDLAAFRDMVTGHFIDEYLEREAEYKTKVEDRIYCDHRIIFCEDGETAPMNVTDVHMCAGRPANASETAFEGLTKGVDYQVCPNPSCTRKVTLKDGCNEMTCVCSWHFCMICGEQTPSDGHTTHWGAGGCPRWGPKSTARPEDFDVPEPDRVLTQAQFDEALRHARADELAHPTGRPLVLDLYLQLVSDRDQLLSTIHELETNSGGAETRWELFAIGILGSLASNIDMILALGHAPEGALPQFVVAFQRSEIDHETVLDGVPGEWWEEHEEIDESLEFYLDQVFHLTRMLEARLAVSEPPTMTMREQWLQQRRMGGQ